jgi:hypothetical protein
MTSAGYYRSEAERCRKLAASSKDPEAAKRWRALARDYAALADELEKVSKPPPAVHVPMQQQPVQQQQSKSRSEDKT